MCVFFYLRHSSNWNPHRLHSEPFPPKENHNVGLLRFDDDHDHICYRFAQVQIFGGKSNVFKSLQLSSCKCCGCGHKVTAGARVKMWSEYGVKLTSWRWSREGNMCPFPPGRRPSRVFPWGGPWLASVNLQT
jgi:hypothetical protein